MVDEGVLPVRFCAPPTADEATLAGLPWEHTTRSARAGAVAFRVRASDAALGVYVDRLLGGFPDAAPGEQVLTYSIVSRVNGHPEWWAAYAGSKRISNSAYASVALTHLFAHLNRAVVSAGPADAVFLHAAALTWKDRAVVLAGPTESGKSTLAGALSLCGLGYLTDEVVQVDPEDCTAAPYPKPPSIDPGSWGVLAQLRPRLSASLAGAAHSQWHVEPALLPGGVAVAPAPVHLILRCRWRPGSGLALRRIPRAGLVVELALDMFRPRERLAWQVQGLGRLVERALVYELVYDDLEPATDAVLRLMDQS